MFLKRNKSDKIHQNAFDGVGTEAVANVQEEVNANSFNYPSSGFISRIEHTLLYTMIREADIFPADTVIQTINEENYSTYLYVRPKPGTNISEYEVSYAQLTAILALAAEEWPYDSEIPPVLCQKITQCVLRYANEHDLDRKTETDDLLQPLYKYACRREAKQSKKMLKWIIPALGASIIVGNPLPAYAALVGANLAQSRDIEKGNSSNHNTDRMMSTGERAANVEHTSLLDEDGYDDLSI